MGCQIVGKPWSLSQFIEPFPALEGLAGRKSLRLLHEDSGKNATALAIVAMSGRKNPLGGGERPAGILQLLVPILAARCDSGEGTVGMILNRAAVMVNFPTEGEAFQQDRFGLLEPLGN